MTLWNSSNISRCVKVEVKMIGRSIWHPIAWCVAVWTEICRVSLASNRTWDVRVKICRGVNQGCGGAVKATSVTPPTSVIDTTLGLSPDFTWLEAIIPSTIAVVLVVLVYLFSYAYFSNRRRMMDNDVCLNFHRRRQLLCNITEEVCRRSNSAITARPPISIPERRFKTFPGNSSRCLPLPS
uniref:Uncharacterized protein n=1 Tax=Ciona savignyi TaxID=51511 RepID=H2Z7K3_CIOSA